MPGITSPILDVEGISTVLVGSLNPAIFHPLWFSKNGLVPDAEAKAAEIKIVSPDITVFTAEWFSLQVSQERFVIETRDPSKVSSFRDLVRNTFAILEHTPILSAGLNSDRHYRMNSEDDWHAVGDHYAPKSSWMSLFDSEPRVGMRSLMIQGGCVASGAETIYIKIEPSQVVRPGVYIALNQHYKLTPDNKEDSVRSTSDIGLFNILDKGWNHFLEYRDSISNHIFSEVQKG